MHVVISGSVDASYLDAEGREAVLDIFGPQQIPGLIDLVDKREHTYTALTSVDSMILFLDRSIALRLMRNPSVQTDIVKLLVQSVRRSQRALLRLSLYDLETRLALYFSDAAKARSRQGQPRLALRIFESQPRIALKVRASRARVNMTLQKWVSQGHVKLEDKRLIIYDQFAFWQEKLPNP